MSVDEIEDQEKPLEPALAINAKKVTDATGDEFFEQHQGEFFPDRKTRVTNFFSDEKKGIFAEIQSKAALMDSASIYKLLKDLRLIEEMMYDAHSLGGE